MQYLMIVIILIVGISGLFLFLFGDVSAENGVKISRRDYERLFGSNNKNSYRSAREVYKVLEDAKIESYFLGDIHE